MVEDSFRFRIACGTLYVGIVATTTITLVLCPPWQGVIYHRDREGVPWHASEQFRLRGVNAYTNQAPIWNPPQPWSPPYSVARAVVRFPWQRITDGPNVEIMLGLVMTLISAVTATTGVLHACYEALDEQGLANNEHTTRMFAEGDAQHGTAPLPLHIRVLQRPVDAFAIRLHFQ